MKKANKIRFTYLIILLLLQAMLLTGCSTNEKVEIGAWKDNLQGTEKESPSTDTLEIDTEAVSEGLNELKDQITDQKETGLFDGIISTLQQFGKEGTETVLEQSIGYKYTVEKDTGLTKVKLIKVVDGDTLLVHYTGETYIRLIGVNTPESVHPEEEKNTQSGVEASNHTKELLKDAEYVWLEFDEDLKDDYDRTLAYVWLKNDTSDMEYLLNAVLLKEGYAEVMTIEPNTKYADTFNEIVR